MAATADVAITDRPFVEGAATEAPIMIDVRGNTYEDIVPVSQNITRLPLAPIAMALRAAMRGHPPRR